MRIPLFVPILALFLTGCEYIDIGDSGRYHQDFHYSYPLAAGGKLQVESFNGAVEISTWDQNEVDISGTKWGPTAAAADALRIDIDHTPNTVSVRAARPIEPRNHLGARFAIKVPKQAVIDRIVTTNGRIRCQDGNGPSVFRTSNGSIQVESLHGSLNAQTSNGPVDLLDVDGDATVRTTNGHVRTERLRGTLDASTRNGSITAEVTHPGVDVRAETSNGSVDLKLADGAANGVKARTSNGSITVRLPTQAAVHVVADTSNSTIRSDFEMKMRGEMNRHHLEGDIGPGGPLVELKTSNGSIRLLKM